MLWFKSKPKTIPENRLSNNRNQIFYRVNIIMTDKTKSISAMIVSALSLSIMQLCIAKTSAFIPLPEQVFFRNILTSLLALVAIKKKNLKNVLGSKENRPLLLLRSVLGTIAMYSLFYAAGSGNPGDVAVLSKLSPFFAILFACIIGKERMKPHQIICLVLAITGASITANPSFKGFSYGATTALACSFFSGAAYFVIGKLKGKEEPEIIVFFFSIFMTLISIVLMSSSFVVPTPKDALLLVFMSLSSAICQLSLTFAYSTSEASLVSVYNYTGIPFSIILGYVFLSQNPKTSTLIGAGLVIVSGIVSFFYDRKN